ncbi:hypothetical protein KNP414_00888 [Paenibacillus mucilaginosus KNP414]|uniref:Uncharacterized protein n=1 Tax=Paenibacillus mucilaginosus (strain KNP414) TaxID=1036673 RepID=F8F7J3_PAEMK|nr:hypothetical protein KNP414_00888 [Paenibacillus mucilaginosus KNP414]
MLPAAKRPGPERCPKADSAFYFDPPSKYTSSVGLDLS